MERRVVVPQIKANGITLEYESHGDPAAEPILLIMGLFTRASALALLGMTLVIEIFVYPNAFDTHGVWAVALLYLAKFGPGQFALDRLLFARAIPNAYGRA